MDQLLQFTAVHIEQLVCSDNFHICHEVGWLKPSAGDAFLDFHISDANLVEHFSMLFDGRIV